MAFGLAACGGGGGGDLKSQVEKHSKALCECKDAECAREHMKEINKITIKNAKDIAKMSEEDRKALKEASLKAGDCQLKLKTAPQ
jgi:hypothetical protein